MPSSSEVFVLPEAAAVNQGEKLQQSVWEKYNVSLCLCEHISVCLYVSSSYGFYIKKSLVEEVNFNEIWSRWKLRWIVTFGTAILISVSAFLNNDQMFWWEQLYTQ